MADTGQVETAGLQKAGVNATGAAGGAAATTPAAKAVAMATAMQERVMALPVGKRNGLLASVAFLTAVVAAMIWYVGRTDWRVLFTGLDGKDVQQVSQELGAAQIPFEMTADGAGVQVPAEMLDKARMEVAAKGIQWSCPVLSLKGFEPEAMSLALPRLFVEEFGVLPLRVAGQRILYLAFEDRLDASAALAVEQMSELKVESGLMDGIQFREARATLLQCDAVAAKLEAATSTASLAARITAILEQKQPVAARLVRLRQYYWLRMWLESGAASSTGSLPRTNEDVSDSIFTIGARS
jgi:hypothetical protein